MHLDVEEKKGNDEQQGRGHGSLGEVVRPLPILSTVAVARSCQCQQPTRISRFELANIFHPFPISIF